MKRMLLLAALCGALRASGQLVNGSFEQGLAGWEWTCGAPLLWPGGAPGAGEQHASKEMGQTQGCILSFLFQRLGGVQHGDLLTIGGWVRAPGDFMPVNPQFGLGTIHDGIIHREEAVGASWHEWTYWEVTDTVELQEGDTAILVLSSGLIGGPAIEGPGYFDGFAVSFALGMRDSGSLRPAMAWLREGDGLLLSLRQGSVLQARILDLAGRQVCMPTVASWGGTARIGLGALPAGAYLLALSTTQGAHALRFAIE
ncbi:MAG: hypothetical protein ACK4L7_01435 [Flavobacteriales bacterium]